MADVSGMEAPSLFTTMYTCVAPQDAVSSPMPDAAAIGHLKKHRAGAMHDAGYGLRRIPLLGTWVNRAARTGPGAGSAAYSRRSEKSA